MIEKSVTRVFKVILGIFIAVVVIGAVGVGVQQLWNWLAPSLFGWRLITFWQAVGLLVLCRLLFGRFGGHGFGPRHFRRRWAERMEHMTPEEREKFRQGMRGRCGFGGGEPAAQPKA